MSRIGRLPITIPSGVDVSCNGTAVKVKGKFGTLENQVPNILNVQKTDSTLVVSLENQTRQGRALHGLHRTLINNMIIGVSEQFQLDLVLKGVGYRAVVQGKSIVLSLGYSHPVQMEIPEGISITVAKNTDINLKACDKEQLGLFAAKIRAWRVPEPYKGKGILYKGEIVKRKAGKSGKK
jgi:large subunit ribosomal protein L6